MQRGIVILGLALSLAAIAVAVYAVVATRTDSPDPGPQGSDLRAVERMLTKLEWLANEGDKLPK